MMEHVQKIADAVLYEGYMLYPYRPSSVKNRQRWTFGGLFPKSYPGDPSSFQTEVLIEADSAPKLEVKLRFLQLQETGEVVEREVDRPFSFPPLAGELDASAKCVRPALWQLSVRAENQTEFDGPPSTPREEVALRALLSAHAILHVDGGAFVSSIDPPEEYRDASVACKNVGVWPVLAGEDGARDCMLVSPIILYDYPQIAPESPGNLFDGTEVDEILTLRIMTMTDAEKEEMRQADEHTRQLLERTENLSPEELMRLHGALRNPRV